MQKALMGIVLAAIILTIPSIYERVTVEEGSKTIETAIPFHVIDGWLTREPDLELEQVLEGLKEVGVQSISVEPINLRTLEQWGEISIISSATIREHILLNGEEPLSDFFDTRGIFVYMENGPDYRSVIRDNFTDTRATEIGEVSYIFVPGQPDELKSAPLVYNTEAISAIEAAGMAVIPRIAHQSDDDRLDENIGELLALYSENTDSVLFSGHKLPFYDDPVRLKNFVRELENAGFDLLNIELATQQGFNTAAYITEFDVIRLHSLPLYTTNVDEMADRIIRAVKERNIKVVFLNVGIPEYSEAIETLSELETAVNAGIFPRYMRGEAVTFDQIDVPLWQIAIALAGAVAFIGLAAAAVFNRRWLTIGAIALFSLLSLVYLVLGSSILLKGMALAVAVTAPVFAVLVPRDPDKKGYLLFSYLKAVGITFAGIWLIVVLLNGNQFILGTELFRGVKLVYILPIAFVALYAFWGKITDILKLDIKYWHILLFGLVAAIGFYYIQRTGNAATVSTLEIQARQLLEQLLYVRPRTKEFLIGLPLFVFALYIAKRYERASYFILIPAVIGFLSLVNTFTHFHIPLLVSVLRSFYSIVLGFLIGLGLIGIYKLIGDWVVNQIKARWQT
ncbi:DUF5693 family protein [Planococcus lenghuensis]|uniref:Uncharacterized protein n=1 Tax=Planococcus lenghuensis TaxID=2213202 RepID=A0A1Q2L1J8_9BACL|nr:DUF5693 family protein [Planococcus lenghuensis]AQQ54244.1 hypothetical protein B0X71_14825 [Planococcus lenghuensis]